MSVLITGITGSLGSLVSEKILTSTDSAVTGYSRDECKQSQFPKHHNLTLYVGDIRDQNRFLEASRGIDCIYHFAALKHVDILEDNPEEAVMTNIYGTMNVLHAQRVNGIPRVIFTSTDKAAYPINVYGASKRIAEGLVRRNPNNIVCRYGNVLASRGSVVGLFVDALKAEKPVKITDPNMTRFWITLEEAAEFVLKSNLTHTGGLRIPTMRAANLSTLLSAIAEIMGVKSYKTELVGMRRGEKLNECLRTEYEGEEMHSHRVNQFTEEDLQTVLRPIVKELL